MAILTIATAAALPAQWLNIKGYGLGATNYPWGIILGPDGALWFCIDSSSGSPGIGRITTGGTFTEYPLSNPLDIVNGPDGNMWFTDPLGNAIGSITTAGAITEYTVPSALDSPLGITAGPDGALWFGGNRIGRITTTGVVSEYKLPMDAQRAGFITTGPDGQMWFTEDLNNTVGYAPACGIGLSLSLSGHTLTVNFDVGTPAPATLKAYLVNDDGTRTLLTQAIPALSSPLAFSDAYAVYERTLAVEAGLSANSQELCSQGAFIER